MARGLYQFTLGTSSWVKVEYDPTSTGMLPRALYEAQRYEPLFDDLPANESATLGETPAP